MIETKKELSELEIRILSHLLMMAKKGKYTSILKLNSLISYYEIQDYNVDNYKKELEEYLKARGFIKV